MKTSVIIPALDEEASLPAVLAELPWSLLHQVIVVDNGSRDRTAAVAAAGATVVRQPQRGYGWACLAGVQAAAGADILVFLDADGSFDAAEISLLVAPIESGEAELVLGSRLRGRREPGAMPLQPCWATGSSPASSGSWPAFPSPTWGRFGPSRGARLNVCSWKSGLTAGPAR
jgi:glycosyltransferase involved in cell wall biosynthesis